MKFKKTLLVFCLIICVLFCVSSVAAGDVNDAAIASEKQNVIENQDPVAASEATTEVDNEKMENDVISSSNEEILNTKDNGTFTALQEKINNAGENATITLENDYAYDEGFSTNGITISKALTIDGNNHSIDAKSKSRIFLLHSENIILKNIIFKCGSFYSGGAIFYSGGGICIISSCDFVNCSASFEGGAIYNRNQYCFISSCNFVNCSANSGAAIYYTGFAYNLNISSCNFTDCYTDTKKITCWAAIEGNDIIVKNCIYNDSREVKTNSFNYLAYIIDTADLGSTIILKNDYEYDESFDIGEISISNIVTIDGNGHIIDAKSKSRIFNINVNSVFLKNIKFMGGNSTTSGGAIYYKCNNFIISSCSFINCFANSDGGAISCINYAKGNVSSCNFTDCHTNSVNATCWAAIGGYYITVKNCTYKDSNVPEGNKFINLQKLIDEAEPGSTITLEKDYIYGGSGREIRIYKPLTIDGNNHIIDANSNSRIVTVDCDNVVLKNIVFTGGVSKGGEVIKGSGAIYNSGNNCSVISCNFTNCRSNRGGGAISNDGDNFTMKSCNFNSCTASYGGAFNHQGSYPATGSCHYVSCSIISCSFTNCGVCSIYMALAKSDIESCNFINCSASSRSGGAIMCQDTENIKISSCNFTNCYAEPYGGAIYIDACENCSISYCNFIKCYTAKINTTEDGAIYIKNSNVTVENCTYTDSTVKIATIIVSSPVTTVYNGNKYLIATLKDIDGNALSGFEVSVDLNGVKILPTDENGQVKVSTNGLTPKTYDVAITFAGNENYTESNTTTKVVINKDSTKLAASAVATVYNVNKNLVVTLKDSQGRALNGVTVSVNINGAKTYTTKNGQVKIAVGSLAPKTYTAKISFAGNDNYNATSANVKVTVKKATPKLTAKAKTFKKSVKIKKYTVTLKTNQNKVMKNTKLTLKVNGKTYKATTNTKGQATFKITKLNKKGKFTAVVKFAGNKYYNVKTAKPKITVK